MAEIYCNDGGSNTSPYDTWAKAATTLATAVTQASDGDNIWVQSDHSETTGAATYTGGTSTPVNIISVTNTNEPPESGDYENMVTGGGSFVSAGGDDIGFNGYFNMHGLDISSADNLQFTAGSHVRAFDCLFTFDLLWFLNDEDCDNMLWMEECTIEVGANDITPVNCCGGQLIMHGGSLTLTGNLTNLVNIGGASFGYVEMVGVDLSALVDSDYLVLLNTGPGKGVFSRCKVPAWNAGGLVSGTVSMPEQSVQFHSVSASDIIYQLQENNFYGTITSDNSVYLDATYDGTNGYSVKVVTTANAKEWINPCRFKLCDVWSSANPTITVEFVNDGTTFQDDELWIEVEYPDSTIKAYGKWQRFDRPANSLVTPANIATSSETWTGTGGFGSEVKQKLDYTISGGGAGVHRVWVCLAKPSATVYVDPYVTLS